MGEAAVVGPRPLCCILAGEADDLAQVLGLVRVLGPLVLSGAFSRCCCCCFAAGAHEAHGPIAELEAFFGPLSRGDCLAPCLSI